MINFVAVIGDDNELGFNDGLPWPNRAQQSDLARYHKLLKNQIVVVGRRTYAEYKNARKSLGTDKILVLSSDKTPLKDAKVIDIDDITKLASHQTLWVIGGAKVFSTLMDYADNLYLTRVHSKFKADRFFPEIDPNVWRVERNQDFPADEKNMYPYSFVQLSRPITMNGLLRKKDFEEILGNYQPSPETVNLLNNINLVLLTAPTASGRNTIINHLTETGKYYFVISDTTRHPRVNNGIEEQNGREYWFRSEEEILADLKGGLFLEAAIIHDQQVSGINIRELLAAKQKAKIAINEVEITGADNIYRLSSKAKFIFILPPSFDVWMDRLEQRGKMTEEELRRRLASAKKELEAALEREYYQFVVNDRIEQAVAEVDKIAHGQTPSASKRADALRVAETLLISLNGK